jgi:hypothetical protein
MLPALRYEKKLPPLCFSYINTQTGFQHYVKRLAQEPTEIVP